MSETENSFFTIKWDNNEVMLLDQRKLPDFEVYERYNSVQAVADAIKTMVVRGAPAIGVTAAYGVALAAIECKGIVQDIIAACDVLGATRPTAVNLFWSIDRMKKVVIASNGEFETILKEAHSIFEEDIAACKKIGTIGAAHFKDGYTVLTHCNAGALATAGWGTALGVIRSAVEAGKSIKVIADETRPRLQGANLTSWELSKEGIDVTVISDNAAASLMRLKKIDAVVVGADRIAANGDTCNKIGTYSVALAANAAGIPFYVAAPLSTVDINCATGDDIPIEYRDDEEVTHIHGVRILPEGVKVLNPAFDVTPGKYITAIFTEAGEISGNYIEGFKNLFRK